MNLAQALEIISQNGVGHDIRCFLVSGDLKGDNNSHISIIDHYKYHNGTLKIELSRMHFEKHQKNLLAFPNYEFFINTKDGSQVNRIWIYGKFIKIKMIKKWNRSRSDSIFILLFIFLQK